MDVFRHTRETATSSASSIWQAGKNAAEQIGAGWDKTRQETHMPEWMQSILRIGGGEGRSDQSGGSGGEPPKQSKAGAAAAAATTTGAAFGYDQSSEDEDRSSDQIARDDQMMMLTKKMIEVRNILQGVGQSGSLTLPSIVVIGSQSSGKSSVLEAIVGHEFLPKGSNMVTRRPIELTLVNSPEVQTAYGEFPALGLGKISDFTQVQSTLTDLNMAVPAEKCVSDEPIQLSIHSPHVPDLSLIDLPGYIQVVGEDQPMELTHKISALCDRYIQPPNVILAISAADVDLANSTALRASRRVDPRGERTIGVITKLDLVEPQRAIDLLTDKKYPLRLGYVGVMCKIPQSTSGFFGKSHRNLTDAIVKNEKSYLAAHPRDFGTESGLSIGVSTLKKTLMHVLEQSMASSLAGTRDAIIQELEEATYEFKVQYNERPLSAESYLAENLDRLKHSFTEFNKAFGRPQVREMLKETLEQRVLDILAKRYWNKPLEDLSPALSDRDPLADLPQADPDSEYWRRKMDASTADLTKLGIGRLATTVVANALEGQVDRLISASTFASHPSAQQVILEAAHNILNDRFYSTSDQVENCIKPYKFEIEVDSSEWAKGRDSAAKVLKKELLACEDAKRQLEGLVGKRKLKDVVGFIDRVRKAETHLEGDGGAGAGGFSSALLRQGREAVFLRDRSDILKMRLQAIQSKQCSNPINKYHCPEIFLDVVADKLTSTAVLFLNVELLSEFSYHFPRELDVRLGRQLDDTELHRFANEDSRVRRHLDVIRRKEMLELALEKIESLRRLGVDDRVRRWRSSDNSGSHGAVAGPVDGSWRSPSSSTSSSASSSSTFSSPPTSLSSSSSASPSLSPSPATAREQRSHKWGYF